RNQREFASGPRMRPEQMIARFKETVREWKFDVASIGFPARVWKGRIIKDPKHLGKGWAGFNFGRALGKPVRVINDAAMQALGSYHGGGRMLFLGLGTGLGSALVWKKTLLPLELGDLPYPEGKIIENYLGVPGLELHGEREWKREVIYAVTQLKRSFIADYVILVGGIVGTGGCSVRPMYSKTRRAANTKCRSEENRCLPSPRLICPVSASKSLAVRSSVKYCVRSKLYMTLVAACGSFGSMIGNGRPA